MIITIQNELNEMWQDQWSTFIKSISMNGLEPESNCRSYDIDVEEGCKALIFGAICELPEKLFKESEWTCYLNNDSKEYYNVFGINDTPIAVTRSGRADTLPDSLREVPCIVLSYMSPAEIAELLAVVNPNRLTTLCFSFCNFTTDLALEPLMRFKNLKHLHISEHQEVNIPDTVMSVYPLSALKHLESLSLAGGICQKLKTIESLTKLPDLTDLALFNCPDEIDLRPLIKMPKLDELALSGSISRRNLNAICELIQLDCLSLNMDESFQNVRPLAALTNLRSLLINGCSEVADITPLAELQRLEELHLLGCESLINLRPLAELQNLESLLLFRCAATDVTPLARLNKLHKLVLSGCTNITDVSPLSGMKNLKELHRIA